MSRTARASLLLAAFAAGFCSLGVNAAEQRGRAKHVVLVVWDGMRPDFVTEQYTPNLWKLAQEGVTFRNHHSVYPSLTNVNGTALATGVFPGRSGVIANNEFRPQISDKGPVDTALSQTVREGDEVTHGHYLAVATVAEILQEAGRRTAVAGTKWVASLFDRRRVRPDDASPALTDGKAVPAAAERALQESLGDFPARKLPNQGQDAWTTSALVDVFWKESVPDFSLLWLSEPDFSEHDTAPGAPDVLAAIQHSDAQLGRVLTALEAKNVRAATDVLVVSDHGFSTIERANDLPVLLRDAGFNAAKKFEDEPEAGSILIAGNAGTALFYIAGHDKAVARRLVEWLQQSGFAGVIFTRAKMEGTFAIDDVHLSKPDGPDVIAAFRWNDKPNQHGTPGMIMSDWNRAAGKGTHATLSKFDLHNTLVAAGPDFRRAHRSDVPSGNIDIAATILRILGITPPTPLDGRVLEEAMTWGKNQKPEVRSATREATRAFGGSRWRQYLKTSTVGKHTYFDEGNGSFSAAETR